MTWNTSDGRVLACIVTAIDDLRPRDGRAIGSLTIAAGILWDRLDGEGQAAWLGEWDEMCGDKLRRTLPDFISYRREPT